MAQFNNYDNLAGALVADDDELAVWDTSTGHFKNITAAELANAPQLTGKFAPIASPAFTGDVQVGSANGLLFGGATTEGSWRGIRSGDDLVFQRYETGTWVTKGTITSV